MTGKMTCTIEISATASVSEAQMNEWLSDIGKTIANNTKQIKDQSWNNRIYTNYGEYEKVDMHVEFKVNKETY